MKKSALHFSSYNVYLALQYDIEPRLNTFYDFLGQVKNLPPGRISVIYKH